MLLLSRWTTDFDCGKETNWWYIIKDTPFDLSALKSKRRYEINKGSKYFDVRVIDPCEYKEELYHVQVAAFSAYPKKYRPTVDKKAFINDLVHWNRMIVFGAFYGKTSELAGYAYLAQSKALVWELSVLKTNPAFEKYAVNAALVNKILSHCSGFLSSGGVICDGARSINHETHFQDYLEKYFAFRKAYCHLHVCYNPKVGWLVKLLFPLRGFLKVFDGIGLVHSINAILKIEEIRRSDQMRK